MSLHGAKIQVKVNLDGTVNVSVAGRNDAGTIVRHTRQNVGRAAFNDVIQELMELDDVEIQKVASLKAARKSTK